MNPAIKARWITALESGEYSQGPGRLGGNGKHCCLGVLSELAVEDGVVIKKGSTIYEYGTEEEFEKGYAGETMPPDSVALWAGLDSDSEEPTVYFDMTGYPGFSTNSKVKSWHKNRIPGKIIVAAHELNDDFCFSFGEIANLLKCNKDIDLD